MKMRTIWVKFKTVTSMKKIFTKAMLVAAAAMAFFACQKQEEFQPEFEEVNGLAFASEKPSFDDETKTHWTGETIHWSKGDYIRVAYTRDGVWQAANGNPPQGEYGKLYASDPLSETIDVATFVVPGTFKGSEQGDYKFYGIYPSTLTSSTDLSSAPFVSIDIQSVQTPAVNSFDAKADVMVAQSDIYNGMPKNGDENGSISLKWNRLVAHGHITLKSLPVDGQEVVKSIILTADTEADMVGKHKVNFNTQEVEKDGSNATNSITINGTNLTIDANGNVTFWACFLPCTWNSISVSVETDKATYTLERNLVALNKTKTFAKNARNVLAINMTEANRAVKNASSLPFVQDFSGMTGTADITELEGFSSIGGKVYNAAGAIRLASGNADGSITTQLLDLSQNFHVKVTASGWDSNELALIVSTSEPSHTETVTLTAFGGGENFAEHIINFQPVSNSASLTFTAKKDVRCYIKKIEILEGHAELPSVLNATSPDEMAAAGGEGSFSFTLTNPKEGQSVEATSDAEWITVVNVADNQVTYSVEENTADDAREGTITLSYEGAQSVDVVIAQEGKASENAPVQKSVTYTVTSTSAVSKSGDAPDGAAASYSSTYGTKCQLTSGNSMTFTLSGYDGCTIKGVTLSMKSNSSGGSGTLAITAGDKTVASIADSKFNTSNWNGSWSTSYVDVKPTVTSTVVGNGEKIIVKISATANSLYCQSITIDYLTASAGGETPDPDEPETPSQGELKTATILFGTPNVKIASASVTGTDSQQNTWTITTIGTSSWTQQPTYSQVGSSSKPATTITFTTTLPANASVSNISAKFGGFNGTAGTVTLKVGDTSIGTGKLNATNDVVVNSTSTASGNVVTVTVTGISKGVKCYYITVEYTN